MEETEVVITFKAPQSLKAKLEERAANEDRSVSAVVRRIIAKELETPTSPTCPTQAAQ